MTSAVEVLGPAAATMRPAAPVSDVTVIATDSTAMAVAQARLTDWCALKISECAAALREYEENLELAKKNKWRTTALKTAVRREKQRIVFYEKVSAALHAGYCIIPNFQADVFAIRTSDVARGTADSTWGGEQQAINELPQQEAEALPIGEGEYQSPTPLGLVYDTIVERDANQKIVKTTNCAEVVGFSAIEFPFAFAKSRIMTETQRAMAMKVFDEMGALPARTRSRRGDPMVVGRIRKPWMKSWQANNHVTFLVVWWLDTAAL